MYVYCTLRAGLPLQHITAVYITSGGRGDVGREIIAGTVLVADMALWRPISIHLLAS
jgi:hypothetical protein